MSTTPTHSAVLADTTTVEQIEIELGLTQKVVHELTAGYQASGVPVPSGIRNSLVRLRQVLNGMRGSIDSMLGSIARAGIEADAPLHMAEPDDPATCLPLATLGPGGDFTTELRVCQCCFSHFSAPSRSFECFCTDCVPR